MIKKLPLRLHKMNRVKVEPDYNSDGSVSSNGSQEGREDTPCLIGVETEQEYSSEEEEEAPWMCIILFFLNFA